MAFNPNVPRVGNKPLPVGADAGLRPETAKLPADLTPVVTGRVPAAAITDVVGGGKKIEAPNAGTVNLGLDQAGKVTPELVAALEALNAKKISLKGDVGQKGDVDVEPRSGGVVHHLWTVDPEKLGKIFKGEDLAGQGVAILALAGAAAGMRGEGDLRSLGLKGNHFGEVIRGIADGKLASASAGFKPQLEQAFTGAFKESNSIDVHALVESVLRESYMQTTEDLRFYAEKVKFFNGQKKALREHMAKLRDIRAKLAGTPDDKKGSTRLNGKEIPGAGGKDGKGGDKSGESGPPLVRTAADRLKYGKEINGNVGTFLSYKLGGGPFDSMPLETALLNDKSGTMRQKLLDAIPYMTATEVRDLLLALGGGDMRVHGDLAGIWAEIAGKLTPNQAIELAGLVPDRKAGSHDGSAGAHLHEFWCSNGLVSGLSEVVSAVQSRFSQVKSELESETGKSYGGFPPITDGMISSMLADYVGSRQTEIDAERRANLGAADAGLGALILEVTAKEGRITSADVLKLIDDPKGVRDADGQASKAEYDDLKKFLEDNKERLTPGAIESLNKYFAVVDAAKTEGRGITFEELDKAVADIKAVVAAKGADDQVLVDKFKKDKADEEAGAKGAADKALKDAEERTASLAYDPSKLDLDPSDGAIDECRLSSEPPFMQATPGKKIETVAQLDEHMKNLEDKLNSVGDDAQLANVDLQNILQKQQQTLQMMSNISKQLHDTALAVIRKIGG